MSGTCLSLPTHSYLFICTKYVSDMKLKYWHQAESTSSSHEIWTVSFKDRIPERFSSGLFCFGLKVWCFILINYKSHCQVVKNNINILQNASLTCALPSLCLSWKVFYLTWYVFDFFYSSTSRMCAEIRARRVAVAKRRLSVKSDQVIADGWSEK